MARSTFDDLSLVSEGNGFSIRTHVSCEPKAKGGDPKVAKDGNVIQYPISRIERLNGDEEVNLSELIEMMDNAFKNHWDNHLDVPAHVSYPSLAYRICIGLNHAHSLEHADRWPSGLPTYRFDSFVNDLNQSLADCVSAGTTAVDDPKVQGLLTENPAYATRWREEAKAAKERRDAEDALLG